MDLEYLKRVRVNQPLVHPLISHCTHSATRVWGRDTCRTEPETNQRKKLPPLLNAHTSVFCCSLFATDFSPKLSPRPYISSHSLLLSLLSSSPFLCHNSLQMLFISQAGCRWKHSTQSDASAKSLPMLVRTHTLQLSLI